MGSLLVSGIMNAEWTCVAKESKASALVDGLSFSDRRVDLCCWLFVFECLLGPLVVIFFQDPISCGYITGATFYVPWVY